MCSQLPSRVTAGKQTEVVERIEEMSAAAGWLARVSGAQVVEFVEILWWARSMLLVGVGSWWLCVTRRQKAWRKVATQTEPFDTGGRVYVESYRENRQVCCSMKTVKCTFSQVDVSAHRDQLRAWGQHSDDVRSQQRWKAGDDVSCSCHLLHTRYGDKEKHSLKTSSREV